MIARDSAQVAVAAKPEIAYPAFVLLSGKVKLCQNSLPVVQCAVLLSQSPMPSILPSQIVAAIDNMFGANRNEIDNRAVQHIHKVQVYALLSMLNEVPPALIDLNAQDYLEFSQCRAVLATKLPAWNLGDIEDMKSSAPP